MHVFVSVLFMVVGGVIFCVAANPHYKELGRMSCFAGMLAFLLKFDTMVSFFGSR